MGEVRYMQGTLLPLCQGLSPRPRRGLVFSSVGTQCVPVIRDTWLSNASTAAFDLVLIYYRDVASETFTKLQSLAKKHSFIELLVHRDLKWPNFKHWIGMKGGFTA